MSMFIEISSTAQISAMASHSSGSSRMLVRLSLASTLRFTSRLIQTSMLREYHIRLAVRGHAGGRSSLKASKTCFIAATPAFLSRTTKATSAAANSSASSLWGGLPGNVIRPAYEAIVACPGARWTTAPFILHRCYALNHAARQNATVGLTGRWTSRCG